MGSGENVPRQTLFPVFLQVPSPVTVPVVSYHLSVNGTTPLPEIAMSPDCQRSPLTKLSVQPLFGQEAPKAVIFTAELASAPLSMCAAICTLGHGSLSDE